MQNASAREAVQECLSSPNQFTSSPPAARVARETHRESLFRQVDPGGNIFHVARGGDMIRIGAPRYAGDAGARLLNVLIQIGGIQHDIDRREFQRAQLCTPEIGDLTSDLGPV